MKNTLLLILVCLSSALAAGRIYVSPMGGNNAVGDSWATATALHTALSNAQAGDEIFVLQGTYLTSATNDRNESFTVPAGVHLYGGFQGHEYSMDDRDPAIRSVLSGDLGQPGQPADNAYTVVRLNSRGDYGSTLDGFVVSGGTARNFLEGFSANSAGGGLYIASDGTSASTHMIYNCTFQNNLAHNGGAIYVDGGRPSFVSCIFTENKADFNGGAVYNQGVEGDASPIFRNCHFEDNTSNSGAGMTNNGANGSARPLIISCAFVNNFSTLNGAAIYNLDNDNGECEPVLEGCSFVGNLSVIGNDVSDLGISVSISRQAKENGGGNLSPTKRRK
ncbi:hypothetical protein [Lewinella sp. W8]|uniref:hypothetical protein n=1 Tax=Lewinella sp. W8 TaxID=2528208 RepID=UPI0010679498|nr:hypothetical protein [Lewinella sp. W8]